MSNGGKSLPKPVLVIVGASFGGFGVVWQLRENEAIDAYEVVVLSSQDQFSIGGTWQFAWNNRLPLDRLIHSLHDANWDGVKKVLLKKSVSSWNIDQKQLILDDQSCLTYDKLVLAVGVEYDAEVFPGLSSYPNICSLQHVERMQEELQLLIQRAKESKEILTFVMVISRVPYKCPPAPIEVLCLVDEALHHANARENVRLVLTCPVEWPMPLATRLIFLEQMNKRRIEYLAMHALERIDVNTNHISFLGKKKSLKADMIWSMYPIQAPHFCREALKPIQKNSSLFIKVANRQTFAIENVPDAYAIGDCAEVICLEKLQAMVPARFRLKIAFPKNGEFSWKMGVAVADALHAQLGRVPIKNIDMSGACVAELGRHGEGINAQPDFSDACNTEDGEPTFHAQLIDPQYQTAAVYKVSWVNGYLSKIFGNNAQLLKL